MPDEYLSEMKTLKKLMKAERDAIIGGFVVGSVSLISVRFLPRVAVRILGGEARIKSLRESELATKSTAQSSLKRMGSEFF